MTVFLFDLQKTQLTSIENDPPRKPHFIATAAATQYDGRNFAATGLSMILSENGASDAAKTPLSTQQIDSCGIAGIRWHSAPTPLSKWVENFEGGLYG